MAALTEEQFSFDGDLRVVRNKANLQGRRAAVYILSRSVRSLLKSLLSPTPCPKKFSFEKHLPTTKISHLTNHISPSSFLPPLLTIGRAEYLASISAPTPLEYCYIYHVSNHLYPVYHLCPECRCPHRIISNTRTLNTGRRQHHRLQRYRLRPQPAEP